VLALWSEPCMPARYFSGVTRSCTGGLSPAQMDATSSTISVWMCVSC
jgi:hypothetical protein